MSETPPEPQESISDELRRLGQNLVDTLRAAWESPERKRLHDEISEGLDELTKTIRLEVDAFQESPTGQRIRTDVGDLRERIRSGEVEMKLREEMLSALRLVNEELQKASERWKSAEKQAPADTQSSEAEPDPPAEG